MSLDTETKSRIENAEEKGDLAPLLAKMFETQKEKDAQFAKKMEEMAEAVKSAASSDELVKIANEVRELGAKAQEQNAELLELQQKFARPLPGLLEVKSLGESVAESEEFKSFVSGGRNKAILEFKSFEHKAVNSSAASAGVLIQPQRLPGILAEPDQQFFLRDLIMPGTTSSNAIEYVHEDVFTNNAGMVGELQEKPQSDITFDMKTTNVRKIAHWMYASQEILADAPMLSSYINGRLIYGLKIKEEEQLLLGDGTGQNLLGLIPQATAYDAAVQTALDIKSPNKMDILRAAMLQVQLAKYPPSGVVLHPVDWASITLTKDANGNYLIANPQSTVSQMLWSLPVVATLAMQQGQFLVGAFRLAAQVFDREQASIAVSTEDRDNFIKNAVTILAEERLALAVYRPKAIVHGSFA